MGITVKEYADMLNGRKYSYPQFTKEEIKIAKDNGFVIVCGASDDLMEFYGAMDDEGSCYDGGKVWFDEESVLDGPSTTGDRCIEAFWCRESEKDEKGNVITWTYETDIPHETFMIYDEEEPYCKAIVFSIEEI